MSNPDGPYDFAGAGFVLLSLDIGNISTGSLSDGTRSQPLSHLTYNGATGAISFQVATSQTENARNLSFTGTAIKDTSGNAIGFTGSWSGERTSISDPNTKAEVRLPGGIGANRVEGPWAAVVERNVIS